MTWVLALTGLAHEAVVVRQLEPDAPRRVTDLVELLALAQPALAETVLISARFPQMNREVAQRVARHVPCFGVADSHDDSAAARIADWGLPVIRVDPSVTVRAAVSAMGVAPNLEPAAPLAPLIAVTGPHGATGRTTVAAAVATALGRSVLIDADLVAPAVGFHCGATGGTDLTSAARAAADGRLRSGNLLAAAADVERLSVVTGIPHPEQVRDLALSGVEVVLDEAVATGQPVVVDCGAGPCVPAELGAVRRAVIARATHVLSVGVPTALGIRRWVDSAGELGECTSAGTGQVIVVWNRMPRGPDSLRRLREVVAVARPDARVAGLPDDPDTAAALDRRPGTVGQRAPRGRLAAAIAALTAGLQLTGGAADRA